MSRADLEFAWDQTRRLEARGMAMPDAEIAKRMSDVIPEKKAGRPKLYQTEAEKKKAYRERRAGKALASLKTAPFEKVPDIENTKKSHASK